MDNIDDFIDEIYDKAMLNDNSFIYKYNCIIKEYEYLIDNEKRKNSGSFYTPDCIVDFMIKNVFDFINKSDISNIRILDPSCGSGNFLNGVYKFLFEKYKANINLLNNKYDEINSNIIHKHIIKNNIFGFDIDKNAVKISNCRFILKNPNEFIIPNIIEYDSILNDLDSLTFANKEFDIIIGNPPYIGHKRIDPKYHKALKSIYKDVIKDKSDISFCFIKSSIDRLKTGGLLCFITSRYFFESPNGRGIRDFILKNCSIEKIIDFYGIRVMKGISIDPVIIFLRKSIKNNIKYFDVIKAKKIPKIIKQEEIVNQLSEKGEYFKYFKCDIKNLSSDGWILCEQKELDIIKKIEDRSNLTLSTICNSYQGIITGCDKAFIADNTIIDDNKIEKELLRPWIKGKNINKYFVERGNLYIIYSNLINNEQNYKHAICYINKYKNNLINRRECKKNIRKWYELQWGRDKKIFEAKKIVFPYKASCNKFAIDIGSFSSADIYSMVIKDEYKNIISYEFIVGILNSKLYEFYFKSFAKKLGNNLYDYYPNTVMRLKIPNEYEYIKGLAVDIINKPFDYNIEYKLNEYIYKYFNITKDEIEIIEERINSI